MPFECRYFSLSVTWPECLFLFCFFTCFDTIFPFPQFVSAIVYHCSHDK